MEVKDGHTAAAPGGPPWWRTAVVYQVYLRSFKDGNGDGEGDLRGLLDRLPYIAELGADAVWVNPWYESPMADGGYDVTDYRRIASRFGNLHAAEQFIETAHSMGLRVIADIVPNHTSIDHDWFRAALSGDDRARRRYVFRPGKGVDGALPPNDWQSAFGGPAWRREQGGSREWYLHLYSSGQPDLNWENPEVREEFEDVLRFWFDRGIDGLRVDVAHGLVKAAGLPDAGAVSIAEQYRQPHPAWNQPGVHEIFRQWRKVAEEYSPPRIFVAEAWVPSPEDLALYVRPDELHLAFQIDMCFTPWDETWYRRTIKDALRTSTSVGAPATWVLANHDVPRTVTRYARSQPDSLVMPDWDRVRAVTEPADMAAGTRRARAAALVTALLPGSLYLYQGEELGLPEHERIPPELRQDPTWVQSNFTDPGRDGCRVPLPWQAKGETYGFNEGGSSMSWLPQPDWWGEYAVESQIDDPSSMLRLYQQLLSLRGSAFVDLPEAVRWVDAGPGCLAFARGDVQCWVNFGDHPVDLPGGEVLLRSGTRSSTGPLQPDEAVIVQEVGVQR